MSVLSGATIQDFMVRTAYTAAPDLPLFRAREIMITHGVHHFPVQHRDELVGVISERDIEEALALHASARDLRVGVIMRDKPYAVSPGTPFRDVLSEMVTHGHGYAVVKNDGGRAIGIFTCTDAVRLLAKFLDRGLATNDLVPACGQGRTYANEEDETRRRHQVDGRNESPSPDEVVGAHREQCASADLRDEERARPSH